MAHFILDHPSHLVAPKPKKPSQLERQAAYRKFDYQADLPSLDLLANGGCAPALAFLFMRRAVRTGDCLGR